jgi:hypothetical protein
MGIYRGPGGTGDAVNDASSQATITVLARDEAVAAKNAAQLAQAAAELAKTGAQTAETGAVTAKNAAQAAQAAAEAASLPSQTGNSGKYLKTNGTTPSWDALDISTADISGTLPVANGGTGSTTAQTAVNTLAGAVTSGSYLRGNGTNVVMSAIQIADVPTLNQNTTGTAANITGTVAVANGGSGTTTAQGAINTFAGAVTSGSYLRGNGTNVTMSAIQAADIPTLNQNTTGTSSNVTGTVAVANGGTGATTAAAARTGLGATTLGANLFTIANPSAITFPRYNADNTVSALDAATFRTAIGAGTSSTTGTVTSVTGTAPVVSSGGNTPAISMPAATSSVSGYLTSTDWSTFNGKGAGTVTSVAASVPAFLSVTGSPITSSGTLAISYSGTALPVANGGTGATTLTGIVKGSGTSAFSAATAGTDYVAPGTSTSFTALQTFLGTSSVSAFKTANIVEPTTVSATAATGTINYDVTTQSVLYYTSNASANWTVNFRGSSGTSLNTLLSTNDTIAITFMVTQGTTAYYNNALTIDGTSVTAKWAGGSAPTSGNASGIDVYNYVITKTASATYTVLASQTQFK